MVATDFDTLATQLASGGPEAVFEALAARLRNEKKFHELFDAILMRTRWRLGLPAILTTPLDDLAEPVRSQVEEAYLAACREVGSLLLAEGKLREAWMYLRPVGDKTLVAEALAKIEPNEENLQDLVEIALHEGVAPAVGYKLVLDNYGTCNAITTFESVLTARPRADQQAAASLLLAQLHKDLVANVRSDIERQSGSPPNETTLAGLVADREWLFLDNNYHIDTTHLASTVRFARLLEDPNMVRLALDLTEYGRRLGKQFQFQGEEPFLDLYPAHAMFFAAQLGEQVDEAVEYFKTRATEINVEEQGSAAAETYVVLLCRLRRYREAIDAAATLMPPGTRTGNFAPTLLELARLGGTYDRLMDICRERDDVIGFTAGLLDAAGSRTAQ